MSHPGGRAQLIRVVPFCLSILLLAPGPSRAAQVERGAGEQVADLNATGVRLFEAGEFAEALHHFKQALAIQPNTPEVRKNIGKTHSAVALQIMGSNPAGDRTAIRRALENLKQALLYWEGNEDSFFATGLCHLLLGELPAAERALGRAVDVAPRSFRSWRLLAVVREQRQHLADALLAFERAAELHPGEPWISGRIRRLRYDRTVLESSQVVESRSFRIHFPTQVPREVILRIQEVLEKTQKELRRRWSLAPPEGVVVICYPPGEFGKRAGFHEFVGGAFDGKIRIAFPAELTEGGLELAQVVRHETVHLMLNSFGNNPPRWLDEGIAQVLDGEPRIEWVAAFGERLEKEPHLGLADRESLYRDEDPDTWAPLYLHAFCFIQDLVKAHQGFRLDMMVREAARGRSWSEAFRKVYGELPGELDKSWRRRLLNESR